MSDFREIPRSEAQALLNRHIAPGKLPPGRFWLAEGDALAETPDEAEGVYVFSGLHETVTLAYRFERVVQMELF